MKRASILATLVMVAAGLAAPAHASGSTLLRLITSQPSIEVQRFPGGANPLDLGLYVAADGAPFEVRALLRRYNQSIHAFRALRTSTGIVHQDLGSLVTTFDGLTDFFNVTLLGPAGAVASWSAPFCPNGLTRVRVSPEASDRPTYPDSCDSGPWMRGAVWGIDAGWAVSAPVGNVPSTLPDGSYTAVVRIGTAWAATLGLEPQQWSANVDVRISTFSPVPPPLPPGPPPVPVHRGARRLHRSRISSGLPAFNARPDLVPLPAWSVQFETSPDQGPPVAARDAEPATQDILTFAATIYNAGPSPLIVDGFRRAGTQVMDAYQSFYVNGRKVATKRTGFFEYHAAHHHWHFLGFATHRLLDSSGARVMRDDKEGFCLAPTDAIDLTIPGAEWRPGSIGLSSACGDLSVIGLREALPAGWADTYGAGTEGQSFDVTDLPNGIYYIEIVVNPNGSLFERSTANNRSLRKILIGGTPGNRTVTAFPYQGVTA